MPNTPAPQAELDLTREEYVFVDALVGAMTGYTIAELPAEDLDLVGQCVDTYYAYIENYFAENFEKRDYVKLMAAEKYTQPQLTTDTDLRGKYLEAYDDFLKTLRGEV